MTCSLVACSFQVARLAEQKAQQAASKAAAEVQREAELARKVEEAVVEQEELRLSLGAAEEQNRALQEQLVEEQAKTSAAAAAVAAGATATQPEVRAMLEPSLTCAHQNFAIVLSAPYSCSQL